MAGSNKFIAAKPISLAEPVFTSFSRTAIFFKTCLAKDSQNLGADKEIAAGAAQI
jgi:hypothetical protein